MEPDQLPTEEYTHPVAYDAEGQPLYAHPPVAQAQPTAYTQPQVVHMSRPVDPVKQEVSLEVKLKHDKSKQLYPTLNLSESEYIIYCRSAPPNRVIYSVGDWCTTGIVGAIAII